MHFVLTAFRLSVSKFEVPVLLFVTHNMCMQAMLCKAGSILAAPSCVCVCVFIYPKNKNYGTEIDVTWQECVMVNSG